MPSDLAGISVASANDLSRLASFARLTYAQAFAYDLGEARLRAHLDDNMSDDHFRHMMQCDVFYLARQSETLVGFAQVGVVNTNYGEYLQTFNAEASEVRRLYVRSTHQNQGIGSALLERAVQNPQATRTETIYLTTWESNHGAQSLYLRHGFRKVGSIPEYRSDGTLDGYEYIMARRTSLTSD